MTTDSRGPLYPARLPTFHRLPPADEVAELVRWFWIPEWHVEPGHTSRQHLIAYPACNLVVETDMVGISGPTTRASHRDLTGDGWAVGALLWPTAVPSFVADPALIRDRYVSLDLSDLHLVVARAMTADRPGEVRRADAAQAFARWLADHVLEPSEEARLATRMVELIEDRTDLTTVGGLADALAVSARTLQRIARRRVGVGPAAMIRRRRLQEAAARIRKDPRTDLAALAAELGYADQAHLAGDFRRTLGFAPSGYRRVAEDPPDDDAINDVTHVT